MLICLNFSINPLMNNIIEPNQSFDFSKISLANPSGVQGGAYFTKILYNSRPLYIQTQQSLTRQGFIKTGKKFYIDLMFDSNSTDIINWFENLEDRCQKLLFNKSDSWFQNTLELNDIESAFNSTIRVYKSGKYYLVRCNSKANSNGDPYVKIYNENEESLPYTDINNEIKIISILEIQGIKFTSRNFQIEIDIKQIMVVDDEHIFENCLIKTNNNNNKKDDTNENIKLNISNKNNYITEQKENINEINENTLNEKLTNSPKNNIEKTETEEEYLDIIENFNLDKDNIEINESLDSNSKIKTNDNENNNKDANTLELDLEIEDLDNLGFEDNDKDLKEFEINVDNANSLETFTLKKPNQVYFELYKEAREKAKIAKKAAIIAYLEAKNIKKTYMINNINDSDSEFDAEIDEVSESELEGL